MDHGRRALDHHHHHHPAALPLRITVPGGHRNPMPFPSRPPVQREEERSAGPSAVPGLAMSARTRDWNGRRRRGAGAVIASGIHHLSQFLQTQSTGLCCCCPISSHSHRHPVPPRDHRAGDVQVRVGFGPGWPPGTQRRSRRRRTCPSPDPEEKKRKGRPADGNVQCVSAGESCVISLAGRNRCPARKMTGEQYASGLATLRHGKKQ